MVDHHVLLCQELAAAAGCQCQEALAGVAGGKEPLPTMGTLFSSLQNPS